MKKLIITCLLVVAAATSSFAATNAAVDYANAGKTLQETGGTAATLGRLSQKVGIAWQVSTGGYALITQHQLGVKAFGTAFDGTAINWETVVKGSTTAAPATINIGSVSGAGWTVM